MSAVLGRRQTMHCRLLWAPGPLSGAAPQVMESQAHLLPPAPSDLHRPSPPGAAFPSGSAPASARDPPAAQSPSPFPPTLHPRSPSTATK